MFYKTGCRASHLLRKCAGGCLSRTKAIGEAPLPCALSFQEFYDKLRGKEVLRRYDRVRASYLTLADYVDCYVKGIWDKDLFYKAVFTFLSLKSLIEYCQHSGAKRGCIIQGCTYRGTECLFGRG